MNWLWLVPVAVVLFFVVRWWKERKKENEVLKARDTLDRYYRLKPGMPLPPSRRTSEGARKTGREEDWGQKRKREDTDTGTPWYVPGMTYPDTPSCDPPTPSAHTHSSECDHNNNFHTGGGFGGGDYSSNDSSSDSSSDSGSSSD